MPSGTGQSPSTTLPSRSMRMTCAGRSSSQVSSHGLHSNVPSPRLHGDVAGQVVVVALAPQRAGQQHQLLALVRSGISFSAVGVNFTVGSSQRGQDDVGQRVAVERGGVLAAHGAQLVGRDVAPVLSR